jgi:uncharacterized protein (DUF111 family)
LTAYFDDWEVRRQEIKSRVEDDNDLAITDEVEDHNLESINEIANALQSNSALDMDLHCLGNKKYTDTQVLRVLAELSSRIKAEHPNRIQGPIRKPATLVHLALSVVHEKEESSRELEKARSKRQNLSQNLERLKQNLKGIEKEFGAYEYIVRRSAYEDVSFVVLCHTSLNFS